MSVNPEEAAYHLRYISFFIDIATAIVLKVFNVYTEEDISNYLLQNDIKKTLRKLRNDKILSEIQYNLASAPEPDAKKFDICLLIILLSRTGLLSPPEQGWGKSPGQSDLSLSADIIRLRDIRNSVIAHKPRLALYKSKFDRLWKELERILHRINTSIAPGTEEELSSKIEYYGSRCLDAQSEQQYLRKLEEWSENCEEISKLQEKVEELLRKSHEFYLFLEKKPEKYSRYERLLCEGGQFVLSKFLKKHISKQETLRTKLLENHDILKECIPNHELFKQLFATDSIRPGVVDVKTNSDSWDILVLVPVIEIILKPRNMKVINMIKKARKNYAETALMSVENNEGFSSRCEDLVHSIRTVSSFLDEDIQNQCDEHIEQYRTTSTADTTTDYDVYSRKLLPHEEGMKGFLDLYKETFEKLKKSMQEMEDAGICFKKDHVLELKIVTLGETIEKKRIAEDTLETVWQAALKMSENPEEFEDVRKVVDRILEDIRNIPNVKVTGIKRHCILFTLACSSCQGLIQMVDYLTSERFEEHSALLSRELRYIYNSVFRIEGHITFESVLKIVENPENRSENTDEGLNIPIMCSSPGGMRKLLNLFRNEKTINSIYQIARGLSSKVEETISLKLYPDTKGFSFVFNKTDNETTSSSDSQIDETDVIDRSYMYKSQNVADTYSESIRDSNDAKEQDREEIMLKQHDFIITPSLESELRAARTSLKTYQEEIKADVEQTGSDVKAEVKHTGSDVKAEVKQTGSDVKAEVKNTGSDVKAEVEHTGTDVKAEVKQTGSDVKAGGKQTGSDVKTDLEKLKTEVKETLQYNHEVRAARTSLKTLQEEIKADVEQTGSDVKAEVKNTGSDVKAEVEHTGTDVKAEVKQTGSDVKAEVEQTGADVKTDLEKLKTEVKETLQYNHEVRAARTSLKTLQEEIKADVEQTGSDVKAEVKHTGSDVKAEVKQTGSDVKAEVKNTGSDVKAEVEHTGTDVKAEVKQTDSDVKAEVEQTGADVKTDLEKLKTEVKETLQERRSQSVEYDQQIYSEMKKELQNRLLNMYKNVTKISALPLLPEEDITDIVDVYVPPLMTVEIMKYRKLTEVESQSRADDRQSRAERSQPMAGDRQSEEIEIPVHDIFFKEGKPVKLIYVLGEADSGKSTFCKYLVRHWCAAHSDKKKGNINTDLVNRIKQFDFLFYISLRHCSDWHSIEMMLKNVYSDPVLDRLLQNESEKCLIVLDGLDEWTPQEQKSSMFQAKGLPERDLSKDYTVITTSRPWKLSSLRIKKSEIDQTIKLKGIDYDSVRRLAERTRHPSAKAQ